MHNLIKNVEKDINKKIVNNLILSALRLFVFILIGLTGSTGSTGSAVPIKYFRKVIQI